MTTPQTPTNNKAWCAWFSAHSLTNPGPSGIGAVLVSPAGEKFELSRHIPHCTNNESEYEALIDVLEEALAQGCRNLHVRGHSELVINQVFANWKVKAPALQALHQKVRSLVNGFEECTAQWVRREHNETADVLSRRAAVDSVATKGANANPSNPTKPADAGVPVLAADNDGSENSALPWRAWFDGCALGNPGRAGIGAVLHSPSGATYEISEPIGHATNNEAEYRALIAVMKKARQQGCLNLVVHGDSQLVIQQVFGRWQVNSANLRPLYAMTQALKEEFGRCLGQWIPRDQNAHADELSKAGAAAPYRTNASPTSSTSSGLRP